GEHQDAQDRRGPLQSSYLGQVLVVLADPRVIDGDVGESVLLVRGAGRSPAVGGHGTSISGGAGGGLSRRRESPGPAGHRRPRSGTRSPARRGTADGARRTRRRGCRGRPPSRSGPARRRPWGAADDRVAAPPPAWSRTCPTPGWPRWPRAGRWRSWRPWTRRAWRSPPRGSGRRAPRVRNWGWTPGS